MADTLTVEQRRALALASARMRAAQQSGDQTSVPESQQPEPEAPNAALDMARAIPGGLTKGLTGAMNYPQTVLQLANAAAGWTRRQFGDSEENQKIYRDNAQAIHSALPNADDALTASTGGYYQPKTTAGQYAETIASFAPAALAPISAPARVAAVVLPGVLSETGGQITKGTPLEPWARVAGAVAGGIAAGPSIRSINALSSRAGVPLENPEIAARTLMADAVRRDGGPGAVQTALDDWQGASNPALIDVTGNNVRRLVRSAASGGSGEAQNVATTYADRIAGNLQDNSLSLTRRLTPDNTSASRYADELEQGQRMAAETEYRAPYAQPASVTPEMVSALQGPEGRGAIQQAYAAARANRDQKAMAELQDLLGVAAEQGGGRNQITGQVRSIDQALSELSAGSLDRVRIAMRETGRGLAARGRNSMARGYGGRVRDIDTALDQTAGLRDARANYAGFERQKEALELGQTGMNASPEDYAATIQQLAAQAPGAPRAAGIGYRQSLTDAISRPAEGQTGVLNRIATSDAQGRNLAATYGDNAATAYQRGIGNEIDRVKNSRFISPNTGSQTALRLEDAGLIDIPTSSLGVVAKVWDKIKSSTQLTDQERTALVRMGTTEARVRDLARANPSLSSRALTQAVLGANSGQR